jgi:DNA processing protein
MSTATSHPYNHEQLLILRLALCAGIGPIRHQALLDRFGSVGNIFSAGRQSLLSINGIGPTQASRIENARTLSVESILRQCEDNDLWLWFRESENFPKLLNEIPDPPLLLFAQGEWQDADRYSIGIVGTRRPTAYGRRQASRLASSLTEAGLTIVSGLARGIDATAHQSALDSGGRTIAVLGSGLLKIYPRENQGLAKKVQQQGILLTESPPQRQAIAGAFPQRNRIISGVSAGVIVVEAAERSGALITARHAMEQGREVFAVPGPADSPQSRGCHKLLRDGAKLVESVDDVLEEVIPLLTVASEPNSNGRQKDNVEFAQLSDAMQVVYSKLDHTTRCVEDLALDCQMPIAELLSTLTQLELKRLIIRSGPLHVQRRF